MAKIISISGAQSSGKTTFLETIKQFGFAVDDFKVARTVLAEFGKPLYEIAKIGNDQEVMKFQNRVLELKIQNDTVLKDRPEEYIFVERCPADIFAFTKLWKREFQLNSQEFDDWLHDYQHECVLATMNTYSMCFNLAIGKFAHVDDGVRARADTQEEISENIHNMLRRTWGSANMARPRFHFNFLESHDIIEKIGEMLDEMNYAENYFSFYERYFGGHLPSLRSGNGN